jgi:adenine-specific DNA-methyltransferase
MTARRSRAGPRRAPPSSALARFVRAAARVWRRAGGPEDAETRQRELQDAVFAALAGRLGVATVDAPPLAALGLEAPSPEVDGPALLGALHERWTADLGGRRSGGVVYTPPALAEQLAGLALGGGPAAERRLSLSGAPIVDPACGGGALLVGVVRHLAAVLGPEAALALGRRHLLGFDLDPGAVRVANRALALTAWALGGPEASLGAPARVGDGLDAAGLAAVAGAPQGLGAVVANPPHRKERGFGEALAQRATGALERRRTARMDLWHYFLHAALDALAPGGRLAMIAPAYWTHARSADGLRRRLAEEVPLTELWWLDGLGAFPGVGARLVVLAAERGASGAEVELRRFEPSGGRPLAEALDRPIRAQRPRAELFVAGGVVADRAEPELEALLAAGRPLGELGTIRQGIVENPAEIRPSTRARFGPRWPVGTGVFALRPDEVEALDLDLDARALLRPYHRARDIGRLVLAPPSRQLIWATPESWPVLERHPVLAAHLERFRPVLEARREVRSGRLAWWHLHWPRASLPWARPKLVLPQLGARPSPALALEPCWVPFSCNVFVPHEGGPALAWLAGVLASAPLHGWFARHAKRRGAGLDISGEVLGRAPIPALDLTRPAARALHDAVVELVSGLGPDGPDATADRRLDRLVRDAFRRAALDAPPDPSAV